ncbi:Farnesol dehydrogenase, partial [Pseudolycoriella hygida]
MDKWIGKVSVVTGASAGIARRSEKIEEYAKESGETLGKIYARKCDISDKQSVKETFQWIEQQFGTINILVNNAAILYNGSILDPGDDAMEQLNHVVQTNFIGAVQCSREAIRLIEKSCDYGLVININSIAGNYVPFSMGTNVYAASKHALRAFTDTLRHELVVKNNNKIRVSNLSPGVVETEMAVAAGMVTDASLIYKHLPHLSSENVSESVMFLLQVPHNVNITQLTIQPVGEKA